MKWLRVLLTLLVVSAPAWAREAASGFCENGGQVVKTSGINSLTKVQASYPQCTVTVRLVSDGSIAPIFADNAGHSLSNPFQASINGYWTFYADNNRYSVTLSGGGLPAPVVYPDILLNDPSGGGGSVSSVFGRNGAVIAQIGDYTVSQVSGAAPSVSPVFQGTVTLPLTGFTQCLQVNSIGTLSGTGVPCGSGGGGAVASVFGRTGVVVAANGDYTVAQITGAAPLASPALTGTPTAPTPAFGDNTTKVATTAYVQTALSLVTAPVTSVFGRLGVVVAQTGDYSVTQVTGAAPLASPVFTGTPTAPTPVTADNSTRIATTQYVQAQGYLTSGVTGSGTAGTIPKFSAGTAIGDSLLTDNGTLLAYSGTGGFSAPALLSNALSLGQIATPGTTVNRIGIVAPPTVTAYNIVLPTASTTGFWKGTNAANILTFAIQSSINLSTDVTGTLPVGNLCAGTPASPTTTFLRGDCTWTTPAGAGTVTSVGLTGPGTGFTVGSSPITGSGNITLSYASVSAHLFLGNNTSGAAVAGFVQPNFTDIAGTATTGQLPFTYGGIGTKVATIAGAWTGAGAIPCLDANGDLTTSGCTSGTVTSVFGRTGAVTATSGDYSLSQITATFSSPLSLLTNTLSCPTCVTSSASLTNTQLVTGAGSQGVATNANWTIVVGTLTAGASGILDLSLASTTAGFKVPIGAGAVPVLDGTLSVNTTTHALVHGFNNAATHVLAVAATGTGTATTCTNQVVTVISAIAVPTCTSLTTAFLPAAVVLNNATNTAAAAMTLDMSAATSASALRVPNIAGATSTTNGTLVYDSTSTNLEAAANGVANVVGLLPTSITPADNDCVKFTVVGGRITLNTAGAACGSGGGGSGTITPSTATQVAVYTGSTTVAGNARFTDDGTSLTYTGPGGLVLPGSGVAGFSGIGQGTAASIVANTIGFTAPTSVTGYNIVMPGAAGSGFLKFANVSNVVTASFVASINLGTDVGATLLPINNGGTFATTQAGAAINILPAATRAGDLLYWDGSIWNHLAGNNSGVQFLTENGSGVPSWATGTSSVQLSTISAAAGPNTINNGSNLQRWNFSLTGAAAQGMRFSENVASTCTGACYLEEVDTLAGSTANPWRATAQGQSNGVALKSTSFLSTLGTGGIDSGMLYCDINTTTKCMQLDISGVSAATTRTLAIPNGNSTAVIPDAGAVNNFLTGITAGGVVTKVQPAIASLSDGASIVTTTNLAFTTLTDGATVTWALASVPYKNAVVTIAGNRTLNITNPVNGGQYVLRIVQGTGGSRTLALGTGCTWKVSGGGAGAITLSTAVGAIDVLAFTYDGTNCYANLNTNFN